MNEVEVIGSHCFVGQVVCVHLVEGSHSVRVLVRSKSDQLGRVEYVICDLDDTYGCSNLLF